MLFPTMAMVYDSAPGMAPVQRIVYREPRSMVVGSVIRMLAGTGETVAGVGVGLAGDSRTGPTGFGRTVPSSEEEKQPTIDKEQVRTRAKSAFFMVFSFILI